jgi:Asp-tRNA(Asn)/Glu-tRNA(Gln) amidotransferase C subunit
MSKLQIEQLTDQIQLEKTAEEAEMEKIASVLQVIDQASVLTTVGEELFKVAEELENENLAALASDIYQTGERMGATLTKMASEDGNALGESLEIAEDLNKLAHVMAEIADDVQNEEFSKMAEAVIDISNDMTEEANELMEEIDKKAEEGKESRYDRAKKWISSKYSEGKRGLGRAFKAEDARKLLSEVGGDTGVPGVFGNATKTEKVKALLGTKAGLKSLARPAAAYGTVAAALGAAGYAAHKHNKKK